MQNSVIPASSHVAEDSRQHFTFPVDSEMWRINHRKCGLIFGPAAAILQIAHPRIAQGVADHSNFTSDSLGRLRRTLAATNRIAFGSGEEGAATRSKIRDLHRGVKGKVPPGMSGCPHYSAFETDLLMWVLATLVMAALQGFELVYGELPEKRKQQFYREMKQFGTFFGLEESYGPEDFAEFEIYYDSMIHGDLLGSHPLCAELADAIASPRDTPAVRALGGTLAFLPIETIPEPVRTRLGFRSTRTTRGAMALIKKSTPKIFPLLPKRISWYSEALERHKLQKTTPASRATDYCPLNTDHSA